MEERTVRLTVDGDRVCRVLPSRFVLSGTTDDLRWLAKVIINSINDEDHYTQTDVLVSLPLPAARGSFPVSWTERVEQ